MKPIIISRETAVEVENLLNEFRELYHRRRNGLEDDLTACIQKCQSAENRSLGAEDPSIFYPGWKEAQQAKEFAEGRLQRFLFLFPSVEDFLEQDPDFRKTAQAVDKACALRLRELAESVPVLQERIAQAQHALRRTAAEASDLAGEKGVVLRLAEMARAHLTPEQRVRAEAGPNLSNLASTVNHFTLELPHTLGGQYLKTPGDMSLDD